MHETALTLGIRAAYEIHFLQHLFFIISFEGFTIRHMEVLKIVEHGLRGIALPTVTRPPVSFDNPNEELALFTIRVYAYSLIAHIRTILTGVAVLDEAGNTPSARVLCRHVFEWTAHAAYIAENLSNHVKDCRWPDAFGVVSKFDRANSWIKKHGKQHGAHPIQLSAPDAVRLKHWIAAYERFRVEEYGSATVNESYGYLSEHAHPSGTCFLQYRAIRGPRLRFVAAPKAQLPDIEHSLLDWLMLIYRILGLAKEDIVRLAMLKVIESVAALREK